MIKVGDVVFHKLAKVKLKVRKINDPICTCDYIPKRYHVFGEREIETSAICDKENLIVVEDKEDQLTLF